MILSALLVPFVAASAQAQHAGARAQASDSTVAAKAKSAKPNQKQAQASATKGKSAEQKGRLSVTKRAIEPRDTRLSMEPVYNHGGECRRPSPVIIPIDACW